MEEDLLRRAADLAERCERTATVTSTAFLTPAEQYALTNWVRHRDCTLVLHGGGAGCERRAAFFLPFYLAAEDFDPAEHLCAVHFSAPFGAPGHRDYLGAILGLGIRREWVGDILVQEHGAYVFCLPSVAPALLELEQVGRTGVKAAAVELAAVLARRAAVEKTGLKPEEIGVAFITPCPAKVTAAKVPLGNQTRNIDAAIAISRVYPQLVQEVKKMELPEFEHLSHMGSTGLSWAANSGESTGSGQRRYIAADGIENVIKILEAIEDEQFTRLDFVELSACPGGCVGGVMNVENPYAAAARIKRLARDLPQVGTQWPTPEWLPEDVYFNKKIEPLNVMSLGSDPSQSLVLFAKMQSYERRFPGLDCGSCGSPTCHALAEDIVRGYRTEDDCIYLLKEKLEQLAQSLAGLSAHRTPMEDIEHDSE